MPRPKSAVPRSSADNGGNQAKPEAAAILVSVLDQVITRMRNQYGVHAAEIERCGEATHDLDGTINRILPKQASPARSAG